jgi:hypothetical protein
MEAGSRITDERVSVGNLVEVSFLGSTATGIITLKVLIDEVNQYHYDILILECPWKKQINRKIGRSIKDIKEIIA